MSARPPRWLLRRLANEQAPLRLYCFPHSGGSPGEYLRWADRLPGVEVWGVQLPGRGSRMSEDPYRSMPELVAALVEQVDFTAPFAFFGHSLGALVAYETATALVSAGRPGPCGLVLSASSAPAEIRPLPTLSGLTGPELVEAVEKTYGPVPAEVHEDPELRELVLGALRADLDIVSGYRHRHRQPLDCPVVAFGGTEDDEPESGLSAWRNHTTGPFELRMFRGDHFYFRETPDAFFTGLDAVLAGFAARVRTAAEPAPPALLGQPPLGAAVPLP